LLIWSHQKLELSLSFVQQEEISLLNKPRPFSIMIFNIMTFSMIEFSLLTLGIMTFSIKTFCITVKTALRNGTTMQC